MRWSPLPRVGRDRIRRMPAHVMVRDYPESLAPLLAGGVDLEQVGTSPVGEFADPDLLAEVEQAIAWRPRAPSG